MLCCGEGSELIGDMGLRVLALSVCYVILLSLQCVDCCRYLGGTMSRAQVRIRSRKPYCEDCYIHLKCEYIGL